MYIEVAVIVLPVDSGSEETDLLLESTVKDEKICSPLFQSFFSNVGYTNQVSIFFLPVDSNATLRTDLSTTVQQGNPISRNRNFVL